MIPPHDTHAPLAQPAAAPGPTLRTYWAQWTLTDGVGFSDLVVGLFPGGPAAKRIRGNLPNVQISGVSDSDSGNFDGGFLITDPGTYDVYLDGVNVTANTTGALNSPSFTLDTGDFLVGAVLLVTTDNKGGS